MASWASQSLGPLGCDVVRRFVLQAYHEVRPSKTESQQPGWRETAYIYVGRYLGEEQPGRQVERFGRAIFPVQCQDGSHESYRARHDYQFEELLQMGVGFNEVRAYILLRNSGLGSEDKKKRVADAKGELEYKSIVSSLKLLGSKFSMSSKLEIDQ